MNPEASMPLVVCYSCKWVHFQVTKDYVLRWEKDWAQHWLTMPEEYKQHYGSYPDAPSRKTDSYTECFRCGGPHTNFRDYDPMTDPDMFGHTIQPILDRTHSLEDKS